MCVNYTIFFRGSSNRAERGRGGGEGRRRETETGETEQEEEEEGGDSVRTLPGNISKGFPRWDDE